jgi:sporulation protein YlmC with PRC-barrel domain
MGNLRRLLIDPQVPAVSLAHVDGTAAGQPVVVEWSDVAGIGPDAVLVGSGDALRPPRDAREQELTAGRLEMTGKLVLTERGDAFGPLEDIEFDEQSGRLLALVVSGHVVPVDRLVAVGPDALILPAS